MEYEFTITMMQKEDIQGKAYVHWKAWQEAYQGLVDSEYLNDLTLEKCVSISERFQNNILVAKENDKVIGFAAFGKYRGDGISNTGEIYAIYVLQEYYGRKAGYALMNAAFERLHDFSDIYVWVLEGNERAIHFYERYGFRFDGEKQKITLGTPIMELRMRYQSTVDFFCNAD